MNSFPVAAQYESFWRTGFSLRSSWGRSTAVWLFFAFFLGTVYRGNLTVALTLSKYPPRPETMEELVNYVDRVTMPPFGVSMQKMFKDSRSSLQERLADMMYLGPSVREGLQQATLKNQAHLAARHVLNHDIAKYFRRVDGSNPLYCGRGSIESVGAAWPIPHVASYKLQLDSIMTKVNEAGLYEKGMEDALEQACATCGPGTACSPPSLLKRPDPLEIINL